MIIQKKNSPEIALQIAWSFFHTCAMILCNHFHQSHFCEQQSSISQERVIFNFIFTTHVPCIKQQRNFIIKSKSSSTLHFQSSAEGHDSSITIKVSNFNLVHLQEFSYSQQTSTSSFTIASTSTLQHRTHGVRRRTRGVKQTKHRINNNNIEATTKRDCDKELGSKSTSSICTWVRSNN